MSCEETYDVYNIIIMLVGFSLVEVNFWEGKKHYFSFYLVMLLTF